MTIQELALVIRTEMGQKYADGFIAHPALFLLEVGNRIIQSCDGCGARNDCRIRRVWMALPVDLRAGYEDVIREAIRALEVRADLN